MVVQSSQFLDANHPNSSSIHDVQDCGLCATEAGRFVTSWLHMDSICMAMRNSSCLQNHNVLVHVRDSRYWCINDSASTFTNFVIEALVGNEGYVT